MTNEQDKLSNGKKIYIVIGITIYLAAFGYNIYSDFSKEPFNKGDMGTLTSMAVMLIVMLTMMRPVFKRW